MRLLCYNNDHGEIIFVAHLVSVGAKWENMMLFLDTVLMINWS